MPIGMVLRSTRPGRAARTALALAAALAIASCGESPGFGYGIAARNETAVRLHFAVIRSDGQLLDLAGSDTAAGAQTLLLSGALLTPEEKVVANWCTVGDLIAYDANDREVARHAPPLCANKQDIWVISGLESPLSSP